ncbi:MAG: cupredoxin domain-containing protein [Janthinobacterium lividum]
MSMRRPIILALLLGPVAAMAADEPTVVQTNKQFSVDTLSVTRDTSVKFINSDKFRHNISVHTPSGETRSGIVQSPGDVTEIPFDQIGLFRVTCLIHPQMRMTIVVE